MSWQARIDRGLCIGSGNCAVSAPEFFDVDDDGLAVPRMPSAVDGTFPVDEASVEALDDAVRNCPGRALSLHQYGKR
jgi:ferredoxin